MHPPKDLMKRFRIPRPDSAEEKRRNPPSGRPGTPWVAGCRDPEPFHKESGQQDTQEKNKEPAERIGPPGLHQAGWRANESPDDSHQRSKDGRDAEEIDSEGHEIEIEGTLEDRETKVILESNQGGGDEEDEKSPGEGEMHETSVFLLGDPPLQEALVGERLEARFQLTEPHLSLAE